MIIGITGFARSGKDTIAEYLVEHHDFQQFAFADPLKEVASVLFDVPLDTFYRGGKEDLLDLGGLYARRALQLLGTEAIRGTFGDDFWIKRMHRTLCQLPIGTNVVISDIRFENEAQFVIKNGGPVWRVVRDNPSCGTPSHKSEVPLPKEYISHTIRNDEGKASLFEQVERVMS